MPTYRNPPCSKKKRVSDSPLCCPRKPMKNSPIHSKTLSTDALCRHLRHLGETSPVLCSPVLFTREINISTSPRNNSALPYVATNMVWFPPCIFPYHRFIQNHSDERAGGRPGGVIIASRTKFRAAKGAHMAQKEPDKQRQVQQPQGTRRA